MHCVTVAIVPGQRFSIAERALASVLRHTSKSTRLIYVDGGSPAPVRAYLEACAAQRPFTLIRSERYLSANAARNLAAAEARTRYVAFVDSDVVVTANWLEPLVECAESTWAWIVGPVCCEGEPVATCVHTAGGMARFVDHGGRRVFRQWHRFAGQPLKKVGPALVREPVEQVTLHCALVRSAAIDSLGPFDERLQNGAEHTDLCLLTRAAAAEVYLEPRSVVTHLAPPPLEQMDLPYFYLRSSWFWTHSTIEHFRDKWNLPVDDPAMLALALRLANQRRLALGLKEQPMRIDRGTLIRGETAAIDQRLLDEPDVITPPPGTFGRGGRHRAA